MRLSALGLHPSPPRHRKTQWLRTACVQGGLFSPRGEVEGCWKLWLPHTNLPIHPQTTKAFLPRMLELQNGHIVCLNSVLALSAIPGAIDYCTSKASAFAFMESLTLGLLDCPGVSATTVLPFHTSTEMFQGMRVRSVAEDPVSRPSPSSPLDDGTYYTQRPNFKIIQKCFFPGFLV